MSKKLPVDGFKWDGNASEFNKDFIKNYNEDSDEGYFLEANVQYADLTNDLYSDLPFLSERIKFRKAKKLARNWWRLSDRPQPSSQFCLYIRWSFGFFVLRLENHPMVLPDLLFLFFLAAVLLSFNFIGLESI